MFDWIKSKFGREKTPEELHEEEILAAQKSMREEQERLAREEEKRREKQRKEAEKAAEEAAKRQAEEDRQRYEEEAMASIPPHLRSKYKGRIKEAIEAKEQAAFEIWESGIPEKKKVVHRTWNPTTQTHEYKIVEVPMSPQERLAEARVQKLGGMVLEEEMATLRQKKRERSLPYRTAKAAAGFGQMMAGTMMLGIAGTAQAMLPRSEPRRARGLVPSMPMEVYSVSTPRVNLAGLRGSVQPRLTIGGLGHLRGATLPSRSRLSLTPRPVGLDLSKLRRR